MDNRAHALALLPERQAHYESCCTTLSRAEATRVPRTVLAAQQSVGFALATLNATRAAAGLSLVAGPWLRSLDELLALDYEASPDCCIDAQIEGFQALEAYA